MQGQYLGQSDKGFAIIFIQGVTEGDGFRNRLVPRKYFEVGPLWQDDINKWRLNVQLVGTTFNSQAWTSTSPNCSGKNHHPSHIGFLSYTSTL
jgi:hypothetical protein